MRVSKTGLLKLSFLLALASGCSGSTSPADSGDPAVGVYTLTSVNGDKMPATIQSEPTLTAVLTGGSLTLSGGHGFDQAYSRTTDGRVTENGVARAATVSESGVWQHIGAEVTFTKVEGTVKAAEGIVASLSGNVITWTDAPMYSRDTYIYTKR